MAHQPPTDEELEQAEARALEIWQNGTDDEVWTAIFREGINVAGELLEKIQAVPDFVVGDLTHDEVIARIERRYPLLGPPPHV